MKEIQLTNGKVAIVDDDDYDELVRHRWYAYRDYRSHHLWYACRSTGQHKKQKKMLMHRVILGALPGEKVDHVNRDGLDNRKDNLRLCDNSLNMANQAKMKGKTSRWKGVSLYKKKFYVASCKKGSEYRRQYGFTNEDFAAIAYNKMAHEMFGEFARLNKVMLCQEP